VRFSVETDIASSPAAAFAKMADVRNETRWNSRVSRAELVSGEPMPVAEVEVSLEPRSTPSRARRKDEENAS
jgi:hypothetical protein